MFGNFGSRMETAEIPQVEKRMEKSDRIETPSMGDLRGLLKEAFPCKINEGLDDTIESRLVETLKRYFNDLLSKSEFPETLADIGFEASDMEKLSPEETGLRREEFDDLKASLKHQWEERNGQPWPKYEEDIYSANGKLIRKAGSDYDAHHIQPLGLGGKNEAGNITPLRAEVHYDKQGIHAPDSPYSKMDKLLGGVD